MSPFAATDHRRIRRAVRQLLVPILLVLALSAVADDHAATPFVYPAEIGASSLAARAEAQRKTVDRFEVFHGFRFTDRLQASGITFRHRVVEDAGKAYKPVHYDHGTGIAVADVDGDGRHDIYFVTQLGANQLWRNLGGGRFENVTARAGVALDDRVSVGAAFADIDNDGDQDLFVTTVRFGNALFENDGSGRFTDISKTAGVDHLGHSSGAIFFDYDRDGKLDLFVTNVGTYTTDQKGPGDYWVGIAPGAFWGHLDPERSEPSILYRNQGDRRFADVSAASLLVDRSWSGDASATDLNGDGFADLYVLNMQGDDHYYENVGGRFFVEKGAQLFPRTPWGSMGIKFFDWDNDGRMDLLLTDMHSDMSEEIGPEREKLKSRMQWSDERLQDGSNNLFGNAFYHHRDDGKMDEISDRNGTENYWPWGVSVDDLNADGWDDVIITSSMNYPFRYGVNSLLLNNRGKTFLDSEFIVGIEPRAGDAVTAPWFDLDCDGADKAHEHCQEASGKLAVQGALGTRSAVIFDLDGDGDLDIVTNEFNTPPQVFVSDLSERTAIHYLQVALVGTTSNRNGLGATVAVVTKDGGTVTKVMDGKSGYLSQSVLPLYFGLTGRGEVTRIEVTWPSGAEQTVPGPVAANRLLTITEPATEPGEDAG